MSRFRPVDRHTSYLLPPSIEVRISAHRDRLFRQIVTGHFANA